MKHEIFQNCHNSNIKKQAVQFFLIEMKDLNIKDIIKVIINN